MGSSLSCLCTTKAPRRNVLVIKPSGKIIKIEEATRVKEIVSSNPHHNAPGAASEQPVESVLPDSFELGCDRLYYFLVAEGQSLSKDSLDPLIRLIHSPKAATATGNDHKAIQSGISNDDGNGPQLKMGHALPLVVPKFPWKPSLHTIPEVHTPQNL